MPLRTCKPSYARRSTTLSAIPSFTDGWQNMEISNQKPSGQVIVGILLPVSKKPWTKEGSMLLESMITMIQLIGEPKRLYPHQILIYGISAHPTRLVFQYLVIPWLQKKLDEHVRQFNMTTRRSNTKKILPRGVPRHDFQ